MPLDARVEQLGSSRPLALTYALEPNEIREGERRLRQLRTSEVERRLNIGIWLVWASVVGTAALFFLGATQEGDADFFRWSLLAILILLAVLAVVHLVRERLATPIAEWPRTQLEIYEHTIAVKLPLSSASYSWAALINFGETRQTFVLDMNTGAAVVIPKRLLPPGDLPHLRDLILRKLRHSHLRV
jgi:hypothetical protein